MKEQIVISGISGRFPESDNLEEFWTNLINGVDMVTTNTRRWPVGYLGLPERKGTLKADLTNFDAGFFGIFPAQAERVDPQIRQLLEVTFEAILDAGVNPMEIRGRNIGVFVGASAHDTFEACRRTPDLASGHDITGSACCMIANRISFAFDLRGPSFCIDTFCSSSLMALHQGIAAIKAGECEAAIIAGVNLLLNPMTSLQIQRLGGLSQDGKCKAFDASGDGFVRAEAIVGVFIQKSDLARRSYATLLHSKTNTDGFKPRGVAYPAGPIQQQLMEDTYAEAGVDPHDVFYVEPHGTGTAAGDPQEVNAIVNSFTKGRDPESRLLIGSTKSNMGHAEPAAALCALAKVVLSLRAGIIPANLHYKSPNPNIPGLIDGVVEVVTKNTPIRGELIGINSTGLGGSNIHVIVQANKVNKIANKGVNTPVLIPISGRTADATKFALEKVLHHDGKSPEFVGLLHKIAEQTISQHPYRGFTILEHKSNTDPVIDIVHNKQCENPPPLWFIFSGMGTLWSGMMEGLMEFELFALSIKKSTEILKPFGLNLMEIMTNGSEEELDKNMGTCFIAVGMGLIALLDAMGIKPDGFIGHSAGELLCSYMDGCMSQAEALISYYYKDTAVLKCSGGAMAAVGLSWEEALTRCPEGIYPACHNAANNVTVSGPQDKIKEFIEELKSDRTFAREVATGGIAYHSPYLAPILAELEANVKATAKNPKIRSSRWVSTSIPEKDWEKSDSIKTGSADYVLNNIKSPVLFHSALKHIPKDAIVLEVSAHALFVSMLRKTLPETNQVLGLIRKGSGNNSVQFLTAIGKLYQLGYNPKLSLLYPTVQFPVSAQTPMIAPLIQWDHSVAHPLPDYLFNGNSGETTVNICVANEEDAYLSGHMIDGRNIFPATGYLVIAWKKFASLNGNAWDKFPVEFQNVRLERAAIIPKSGTLKLEIRMENKSGEFEICESGARLVTGTLRPLKKTVNIDFPTQEIPESKFLPLSKEDIYKELRLQGYEYEGLFKGINVVDNTGKWANIAWEGNWVSFLDTMMQFSIVSKTTRGFYLPTRIQKLSIDPVAFTNVMENNAILKSQGVHVCYSKEMECIKCPGVQINGLKTTRTPRKTNQKTQNQRIIEEVCFIPYFDSNSTLSKENVVKFLTDLVLENSSNFCLRVQERVDCLSHSIARTIHAAVSSQPLRQAEITIFSDDVENPDTQKSLENTGISILSKEKSANVTSGSLNLIVLDDEVEFGDLSTYLKPGGFILCQSKGSDMTKFQNQLGEFNLVSEVRSSGSDYAFGLYRKPLNSPMEHLCFDISIHDCGIWLPKVQEAMKKSAVDENHPAIYLTSSLEPNSGLIGLVNCLKQEPGGHKIRCILSKSSRIDQENPIYVSIFQNDMRVNVIDRNGVIGSYRHLPLDIPSLKTQKSERAFVNIRNSGDLSTLEFVEAQPSSLIQENALVECQVYYSALNFRDVMLATGRLAQESLPGKLATDECVLGLEFSGMDPNGDRVMGMVEARGMATHVFADKEFVWRIPNDWTWEDAATVPVAYSTAFYALIVRGRMCEGESVLIHSGSGAVGQAAITIALSMNCTVYTTVGSEDKKQFLKDKFPQLLDASFANSRDTTFEDHIISETGGRGVDLVLNSLSEEKLQASVRCLAEGGRFLEIGKFDLSQNNALGMEIFLKNVTFHGILLDALFGKQSWEKKEVVQLMTNGIADGIVKPLKRTIFQRNEIESAFRFMASGKHIGKVLMKIKEEENLNGIMALLRTYFDPLKVYIIIGGLGGFGMELANWMIQRGAKKLVLVSRSGVKNGYQALLIRRWLASGVSVVISHCDVTELAGAEELIKTAELNGPIGGIFNLAMVLQDGDFSEQTPETFESVLKPKTRATHCLDTISRKLCPDLDHFVVFSSAACGRGNAGQSNYGYANAGMERICESRKADNLPALAIQWAAIGDVGIVHDLLGSHETLLAGTIPQRLSSCLDVLDIFLRNNFATATVSSMVLPEPQQSAVGRCAPGSDKPSMLSSVGKILGLKTGEGVNNREASLGDLGIDSLTVIELKQLLERFHDVTFSVSEIRELTWAKLEELDGKSK